VTGRARVNRDAVKAATQQLHSGQEVDPTTRARAVPINATSSFLFDSTVHAEAVFARTEVGNQYARTDNPTTQVLADRIASLEGRPAGSGVALSSGQAATTSVMLAISTPSREWVVSTHLFGGTAAVAGKILEPFGVRWRFVAPDADAVREVVGPDTVGVWVETIANPSGYVADIPAIAEVAHEAGAPLVVDNTFGAGGYLCRPLEQGADALIHSTTKWIGGHGVAIGGAVVDGGTFDWGADRERFPGFSKPNVRGKSVLETNPEAPLAERVIDLGLSTMGMTLSPFASFLFLQGLETLSLRVQRACDQALHLAQRLGELEGVDHVVYPGLPSHPSHEVAKRVLENGFGTVMGLVCDSEEIARGTLDRFELVSHLANIGDAKTVAIHPWTTTHSGLTPEARRAAGVTPEMVRISIGIEDMGDLWNDITQALRGAVQASR